jgi:hypothetical protein
MEAAPGWNVRPWNSAVKLGVVGGDGRVTAYLQQLCGW